LESNCRRWLKKKGREYMIDNNNDERKKLKIFFSRFNKKNNGFIYVD
jgi:hypothetical protein